MKTYFPTDPVSQKILNERAVYLAKPFIESNEKEESIFYVRFCLKNEYYGIAYQHIKEVINQIALTSIPHTLPFIAGTINYRGALLPALDLKQIFYQESSQDNKSCIIVLVNEMILSLLVDSIEGSDFYHVNDLAPPLPSIGNFKQNYITGLHCGQTAIINVKAILQGEIK